MENKEKWIYQVPLLLLNFLIILHFSSLQNHSALSERSQPHGLTTSAHLSLDTRSLEDCDLLKTDRRHYTAESCESTFFTRGKHSRICQALQRHSTPVHCLTTGSLPEQGYWYTAKKHLCTIHWLTRRCFQPENKLFLTRAMPAKDRTGFTDCHQRRRRQLEISAIQMSSGSWVPICSDSLHNSGMKPPVNKTNPALHPTASLPRESWACLSVLEAE